jgi:hypothetical protein
MVAHDPRETLRCLDRLAEPSRAAIPLGLLLHNGSRGARGNHDHDSEPSGRRAMKVVGVKAVVTTIPEPMGRRAYRMCGMFCFCASKCI